MRAIRRRGVVLGVLLLAAASVAHAQKPAAFTAADLDAYARGMARETEAVKAARVAQSKASDPAARGAAAAAEWEDATIPQGAQAAGMTVDRYRQLRATVNRVFETLDFQGKVDGPMEVDIANADAALKRRLASDPFAELTADSAAALRAAMPKLTPVWLAYIRLTALFG